MPGTPSESKATVLLHGVSLGEINATRSLVRTLAEGEPSLRVVLSSTTDTGFARALELYHPRHEVVRFPFDFSGAVRRFLDRVDPDVVALMELEAWPNMIDACVARDIPVCVVNGRLSDTSFKGYRRSRPLLKGSFEKLSAVGAQTEVYASRFKAMGVVPDRVRVTDTMKWDTAPLDETVPGANSLADALGIDRSRPLVVAGSTGPSEERLLLEERPDGVQILVAPRKPERFEEVAALCPDWVRRTMPRDPGTLSDLYLLDTLGELRAAYALADVVVVGRSFNGMGGSDPIEAAALGKATVMGPDHHNFSDVVAALESAGALRVVDSPWPAVLELLSDRAGALEAGQKGRDVIRDRLGATQRNAALISGLL